MKWFVFLVGVVLLSSFALAAYEDVLGNNEAYLVDTGELYFKKPFIAYEGTPFDMVLLPDINQSQVDLGIEVYKEGKILPKTFSSVEFENETKVILVWGDVITKDTSYTLVYKRDGRTLFRQPFTIQAKEKIVVDRTLQESTYFPTKITDNQREYLLELLSNKGLDYTLEDFSLQEKQAKEVFSVDKKVYIETQTYNDNSTDTRTVVVIDVAKDAPFLDAYLIETIPKDFAFHVSNLTFTSTAPTILEEDPIVMWHLQDVDDQRIEYAIKGNETLTGNTILIASTIEEKEELTDSSSTKGILLPILLIPLIAGIIIFFSKYKIQRIK